MFLKNVTLGAALALALVGGATAETVGALSLTDGFTRATLPGAKVAGGFVTIANTGAQADRLTGGHVSFAEKVELHDMVMDGTVMKMRLLPDGVEIPAGETVTLKPGARHIMFMGLSEPLVEGKTAEVTLTFEKAGEVTVPLVVMAPGAKAGPGHDAAGMKMDHATPEAAKPAN